MPRRKEHHRKKKEHKKRHSSRAGSGHLITGMKLGGSGRVRL